MAQTAQASSSSSSDQQQEVVHLSAFEVTTTQGHGYVSGNAVEAFKTNESLMSIPQADIVVTNDLIQDIGYENSSDVLHYFGLCNFFQGEALALRGARISYPYTDDMPDNQIFGDDAVIDTIEVIKGPAETLYLNSSLSGVVLKSVKKPLPFRQDIVTGSVDQNGLYRFTGDFTGPLGAVGDAKIGYRLVAVYQHGNTYFSHISDNRVVVFPEFQVTYHNTTVRLSYDVQHFLCERNGLEVLTPSGGLYTGQGRKSSNQPPGCDFVYNNWTTNLDVLQKISDNWEMKMSGQHWKQHRYGAGVLPNTVDWGTQTEYFTNQLNNQLWDYWTVLADATGHYDIGPADWRMRNVDTFGYGFSDWISKPESWTTTVYNFSNTSQGIALLPGQPAGTLAVPLNSAAAINSIIVPPWQSYYPPANMGTHLETILTGIYWQHSIDVIPNWLTLCAGFTWDNIDTLSVANISVLPWTPSQETYAQWLHRLGAVLHLGKEISVYALNSTSFTPATQGYVLQNLNLPPPQAGTGNELGFKTALLGGRISSEFAWFHMTTTNVLQKGGNLPNGTAYYVPIGSTVQEGFDGDVALTVAPGWQLIGSFYAGHDRDQSNNPVSTSYDNSWSIFTRYEFPSASPLRGLAIGGGAERVGSRWIQNSGSIVDAVFSPLTAATGEVKVKAGTMLNGFITYVWNSHWSFKAACANILDETYPLGVQGLTNVDPSAPRTCSFLASYKF